uniref:RNA polymerase subunit H/Rpb5 C-terminal domain-containing protein n=1 Tax=viral metagenome TaxID=1070528 RepID=A0A6C0CJ56_9ZZZZ
MDDRVMKTLKEMLTDRGVKGEEFETVSPAMDETKMYTFGGVLIIYSTKFRVSIGEFNNFISFAKDNGYNNGIIIISELTTSEKVLNALVNYISDKDNQLVQFFVYRSLYFNISKHRIPPKHRLLTSAEKAEFLKKFSQNDLPEILTQDAMAKYIGARPGDIVEVTGMCETTGEYKHWRICVAETTNG